MCLFCGGQISLSATYYIPLSVSRKRALKLALMDLDFVLTNLDAFCVRALLLKAGVVKRMDNNEAASEELIAKARLYGRSQCPEYVENFVIKMKSDFWSEYQNAHGNYSFRNRVAGFSLF